MKFSNIPQNAINLIKLLHDNGYEAYLVGGCVRDLILNKTPHDYDCCTNAKPDEIVALLNNNNIKLHTVGIEYGTVTALVNGEEYEITTYRSEKGYNDSRHPSEVIFETDLLRDLSRRDFTINAMAYNPIHDILKDPYGGQEDLENKELKCVGNPDDRFKEDALRILRALRFAIRYDMSINIHTREGIFNNKEKLFQISKERITEEFRKMLTCGKDIKEYFLSYSYLISQVIPEIRDCINFNQNSKYHTHDVYTHILHVVDNCKTEDFSIKMAALLHDIGKPRAYSVDEEGWGHFHGHQDISEEIGRTVLCKDFRVTSEEREEILKLVKYHDISVAETTASVKRMLNRLGEQTFYKWLILRGSDRADHINLTPDKGPIADLSVLKSIADNIVKEKNCFKMKDLAINGNDIMTEFNIRPGKQIGDLLNQLLEEVMDGNLVNEKECLTKRVSILLTSISLENKQDSPAIPYERD